MWNLQKRRKCRVSGWVRQGYILHHDPICLYFPKQWNSSKPSILFHICILSLIKKNKLNKIIACMQANHISIYALILSACPGVSCWSPTHSPYCLWRVKCSVSALTAHPWSDITLPADRLGDSGHAALGRWGLLYANASTREESGLWGFDTGLTLISWVCQSHWLVGEWSRAA